MSKLHATPFVITDTAHRDDTLKREFPGPQACVCSRAQYGRPSNPLDYIHPTHTRIGNSDGFLLSRIDDVPDVDVGIQRPRNEPLIGWVESQGVDARTMGMEARLVQSGFGLRKWVQKIDCGLNVDYRAYLEATPFI